MKRGTLKRCIEVFVIVVLFFSFALPAIASDPYFTQLHTGSMIYATQDQRYTALTGGRDDDGHYPLNFTYAKTHTGRLTSFWFGIHNSTTGVFNFTPGKWEVGTHDIYLLVIDTLKFFDTIRITVNVSNVNDPPNITGIYPVGQNVELAENHTLGYLFNYTADDPDLQWGDSIRNTYYLDGENKSTSHAWRYSTGFCEPNNRTVGLIIKDNAGLNDSTYWNITNITNVNRAPYFNASNPVVNFTLEEDTNLTNVFGLFNLTLNDLDYYCAHRPDSMEFHALGNEHINVTISDEYPFNLSFTPEPDFNGVERITIMVSDGEEQAYSNQFNVNVTPVPDAPRLKSIPDQVVYAGARYYLDLNATNPDGPSILTYKDNMSILNVSLHSGEINFTPSMGDVGNYSVGYNVTNNEALTTAGSFHLEIKRNHAPWLYDIPNQTILQQSTLNFRVKGGDVDGDHLNITIHERGFAKKWSNATAADFSYTPYINGTFNITVHVKDTKNAINQTIFHLTILYQNFPPVIDPIADQVAKIGKTFILNVTAYDGNGGTEILSFSDNSPLFEIGQYTGDISFAPLLANKGNYTVNITVWDNGLPPKSDSEIFNLEVNYNRAPYIASDLSHEIAWEDMMYTRTVSAFDPDLDPIVFSDNTSYFNINPSTGQISFIPNGSLANRTLKVNITATDVDGAHGSGILTLYVNKRNDAPIFDPPLRELVDWTNLSEGQNYLIYVNATDEEGDPITFHLDWINSTPLFNLTVLSSNPGRALINFTATNEEMGTYKFNMTIHDWLNRTWENVTFTVGNINDPPIIRRIMPYGDPFSVHTAKRWINVSEFDSYGLDTTVINATEGSYLLFNQSSYDPDPGPDDLSYIWIMDGVNMTNTSSYRHTFDYDSEREKILHLRVYDPSFAHDDFYWNISVLDVNRAPIFGRKGDLNEGDFTLGTFNKTAVNSSGWVCLDTWDWGGYHDAGTFESRIIDLTARSHMNASRLNFTGRVPAGTSLTFYARGSTNGITWEGWSTAFDPLTTKMPTSDNRYVQYKVYMATHNITKTPCFTDIWAGYKIINLSLKTNTVYSSVVNLGDFFYDLDPDDILSYSADSYSHLKVTIESNKNVRIEPEDWVGTDYLRFSATDNTTRVYSNLIKVDLQKGTGTGTASSGSSGTRIIVQNQIKKEKEMQYSNFKLIAPGEVTVYKNDSVKIPITLTNSLNTTVLDVKLNASSALEGLNFSFDKSEFTQIGAGNSVNTSLWITPLKIAGRYDVVVTANVRDPQTHDSVKIMINSREQGEHNSSQINTRIAFTQDLLGGHPECFELNELLSEAVSAMQQEQYAKADSIVQKVISDCRYLVTEKAATQETPKPTDWISRVLENKSVVMYASLGLLVVMVIGFFLLYKKT